MSSSVLAAKQEDARLGRTTGKALAERLRRWGRDFIENRTIPHFGANPGRKGCLDDEDTTLKILAHLRTLGPYFTAQDIVDFTGTPEMLRHLNRSRPVSHAAAVGWLERHGFGFKQDPRGQYHDGHEDPAQVQYRNHVYIPEIQKYARRMRKWEGGELVDPTGLAKGEKIVVLWFHDESTFYAHDRRKMRWVREGEKPTPYAKGEGHSLMVADF
ncbi:hypothetical protein K523DRAFT_257506, partial [Schizophyllum commune Tattone D]